MGARKKTTWDGTLSVDRYSHCVEAPEGNFNAVWLVAFPLTPRRMAADGVSDKHLALKEMDKTRGVRKKAKLID